MVAFDEWRHLWNPGPLGPTLYDDTARKSLRYICLRAPTALIRSVPIKRAEPAAAKGLPKPG